MKQWLAKLAVAVVVAGASGGAAAQDCSNFTDVPASSPFCANVEWVKNRGITTGCGAGTTYCPNDSVTRLQMAIFMNRLGRALSVEVLQRQVGFGAQVVPGAPPASPIIRCVTAELAAAAYPRQVVANASFSGLADANTVAFRSFLLVSTNGGMTYSTFDPVLPSVATRATAAANFWATTSNTEQMELAPNTAYVFAIGVRRDDIGPSTLGNFAAQRCQLTASVFNRNGTATPFDEVR